MRRNVVMFLVLILTLLLSAGLLAQDRETVTATIQTTADQPKTQTDEQGQAIANFFVWTHAGIDPYIEGGAKTRQELAEKIKANKVRFINDLEKKVGLPEMGAKYVYDKFSDPKSPEVTDYNIAYGEYLQNMLTGKGVVNYIRAELHLPDYGSGYNAWKLVLEEKLGGREIIIPKVCINVALNPHPVTISRHEEKVPSAGIPPSGQPQQNPPLTKEEITRMINEAARQQSQPSPPVNINIQNNPKQNIVEHGGCGKGCKILIGVGIAAAAGGIAFALTRHHNEVIVIPGQKTNVPGNGNQLSVPVPIVLK